MTPKVGLLVIISLLKLMTRPKSLYENRRYVVNIFLLLLLWIKEVSGVFDT